MTKKQQNELRKIRQLEKTINIMLLLLALTIVIFTIYILGVSFNQEKNISISKNLGATYYTDSGVYIRFDSTDANQMRLVQQIEMICKANNFRNCMNAKDSLGIKE